MATIKPFKGLRPPKAIAHLLAARPYDVLNSHEARIEAEVNPYSLLHITKPEIDFPEEMNIDEHDVSVYNKAVENFRLFQDYDWLSKDETDCLYVYGQTMFGKTQYGIVACCSVEEYLNGTIKKHELTRKDKEEDRMKHVRNTNANVEPVFFSYPSQDDIDKIISEIVKTNAPEYNFTANDGVGHHFWVIKESRIIEKLVDLFKKVKYLYVADGHHRTAAAALVGNEQRLANPNHTGKEEYNFFLAVIFPDNQLTIIDYNRVVKDLNGLSNSEFISKLEEVFVVEKKGNDIYKPDKLHNFGLYLDSTWYSLTAKAGTFNDNDPIGVLDVTILSDLVLDKILNITDLRTSKRIDFVGGIRGLGELQKRVDSGEMVAAFALYPVSMKQLIDIADSGNIMPPKTTWFEPKLRSGLVIHILE